MAGAISVVVPVHRNATTVAELSRRIGETCLANHLAFEVLFVDDASPDASLETLRALASTDERVGVVALESNVGQNRAVVAGLAHARGRTVVIMDADLQDPPEAIPRLVAGLAGFPVVFGGRRGTYQSRWRMLTSYVFKRLLWAGSRMRIPPDAGLFVALRPEAVERILASCGSDPYVVGAIARSGCATTSVPVERARRNDGTSSYQGPRRARVAWRALATMLQAPPAGGDAAIASLPIRERIGAPLAGRR